MCHPIGLDDCQITIEPNPTGDVVVQCRTSVTHKTGIEMEALTGATVAALTIYDMCKALSQNIAIKEIRLIEKRGGKSDYGV
jgi:cyclic pyranopterin phosphate synthase